MGNAQARVARAIIRADRVSFILKSSGSASIRS
jgi:hypothetical protein